MSYMQGWVIIFLMISLIWGLGHRLDKLEATFNRTFDTEEKK